MGNRILDIAEKNDFDYADYLNLGTYQEDHDQLNFHINKILALPLVNVPAIRKAKFQGSF